MKTLRQHGPLSVLAFAKTLERNYKNVHADASAHESVDLIQRSDEGLLVVPWGLIDIQVRLVA